MTAFEFGYKDWGETKQRRKRRPTVASELKETNRKDDHFSVRDVLHAEIRPATRNPVWKLHNPTEKSLQTAKLFFGILGCLGFLSFGVIIASKDSNTNPRQKSDKQAIAKWRRTLQSKCQQLPKKWQKESTQKRKKALEEWSLRQFNFTNEAALLDDTPCMYTIIDMNVGDGRFLGDITEAAFDMCTPAWRHASPMVPWADSSMVRPIFQTDLPGLALTDNGNPPTTFRSFLQAWLWTTGDFGIPRVFMENVCVIGIEHKPLLVNDNYPSGRLESFLAGIRPSIFRRFEIKHLKDGDVSSILRHIASHLIQAENSGGFLMIRTTRAEFSKWINDDVFAALCDYKKSGNHVVPLFTDDAAKTSWSPDNAIGLEECGVKTIYL